MKRIPKLYELGVRFPKLILTLTALLTFVSVFFASRLSIESDLTALLPKTASSVLGLNKIKEAMGGLGYLFITVESRDAKLSQQFAEELIPLLESNPDVLYVDYKRPVNYFKKRLWLYFDIDDLKEMESRIVRALELQKKGVSSVFTDLVDFADESERPDITFKDIFEKYKKRIGSDVKINSADDDGRFLVLKVKAKENAENLDSTRLLLQSIKSQQKTLNSKEKYRDVTVGYTGGYQTKVEQIDLIQRQIGRVSLAVSFLLFILLLAYFKRLSAAIIISIPLFAALLWTGAIIYLVLGHLNIITGFGAAILGGLGSDYGIYLLSRYYHEKEAGHDFKKSCEWAFAHTGKATYASMITTVGSFAALFFSKFGVFVELGIVGAVGLLTTYFAMMLMVPAMLHTWEWYKEKFRPNRKRGTVMPHKKIVTSRLFNLIFRPTYPRTVIIILVIAGIFALLKLPESAKMTFDDGQVKEASAESIALRERVARTLKSTVNQTILITNSYEDSEVITKALNKMIDEDTNYMLVFDRAIGLSSFIPTNVAEKKILLKSILEKYQGIKTGLKDKKHAFLKTLQDSISAPPMKSSDLPKEVTRLFTSPTDPNFFAVYLFPTFPRISSETMKRYQDGIEEIRAKVPVSFLAADFSLIGADTLRLIEHEAPRGMIMILIFFALVLFIMIRPFTRALIILFNLIGALILMSGVLYLVNVPLSVINIGIIPVVLGTGIDCFIHFSHRYDETLNMNETLASEIPAMFMSSFTSIVGFAGLILVSSPGVRSVGWIAVIGLTVVTLLASFVFPRYLVLVEKKK